MRYLLFTLFLFSSSAKAQELFPHNEPASNIPKGVLGVRMFGEAYKEYTQTKNMNVIRFMYGITPKLSVYLNASMSNHHDTILPLNFITHTHSGNQTIYYANNKIYGIKYPYSFGGFDLYAKYRFFTRDGQNTHFRMAVYGEYSNVKQAHDEAEPDLLDDNGGYGAGIIISKLQHRWAASFSSGFIVPNAYHEAYTLPSYGKYIFTNDLYYGRALEYNLSFGYLLDPKKYSNYYETNTNLYVEFMGKAYEGAKVVQNGESVEAKTPMLMAGNYLEIHPGIQRIYNSNWRLDLSVGFNLIHASYTHFYPIYMFGIQRYFYLQKRQNLYSKRPVVPEK